MVGLDGYVARMPSAVFLCELCGKVMVLQDYQILHEILLSVLSACKALSGACIN
jgi:hypothetical protein